jgi:2-dehydro-3-deoxy-L-rhamnonate dehydrogenase (NAD+)
MGEEASRVAIVTGGSGGLGGAIAARLRADGFRVASADIGVSAGSPANGDAAVQVDVTDPTAPVASYPPDAWHQVIAVNLTGVFHCTRA